MYLFGMCLDFKKNIYIFYLVRWIFRIFLIYIKICELIIFICIYMNLWCKIDFFIGGKLCYDILLFFFYWIYLKIYLLFVCRGVVNEKKK